MSALASIQRHIEETRRRYRWRAAGLALAALLGTVAAYITAFLLLDNVIRTGSVVPRVFLIGLCLTLGGALIVFVRRWRHALSDDFMARLMERSLTERENRLINAVQLARNPHTRAVAETILVERPPPLQNLRSARLFPAQLVQCVLILMVAGLVGLLAVLGIMPQRGAHSLSRLFSPLAMPSPYSQTEIVEVTPGDVATPRGNPVTVTARFAGVLPASATIEWKRNNGQTHRIAMRPVEGESRSTRPHPRLFNGDLPPVFAEMHYRIHAGDAVSQWHRVDVLVAPAIQSWAAKITPPEYTALEPFTLTPDDTTRSIPAGSQIHLALTTTTPVAKTRTMLGTELCAESTHDSPVAATSAIFTMPDRAGAFRIKLTGANGLTADETLPLTLRSDRPPEVKWGDTEPVQTAAADSVITLPYEAKDDYGLATVRLTRIEPDNGRVHNLLDAPGNTPSDNRRRIQGAFTLPVASLNLLPGNEVLLQLRAQDNATPGQSGTSSLLRLQILDDQEIEQQAEQEKKAFEDALAALIDRQRINYRNTSTLRDSATAGQGVSEPATRNARNLQAAILAGTHELLHAEFKIGGLRDVLLGLAENEMPSAVATFDNVLARMNDQNMLRNGLHAETELQQRILATLTAISTSLDAELEHQQKVDLVQRLREMIENQTANLEATRTLAKNDDTTNLVKAQDALAQRYNAFMEHGRNVRQNTDDAKFAEKLNAVMVLFQDKQLYPTLIEAAESLDAQDIPNATTAQVAALKWMKTGLAILNAWSAENAVERLQSAHEMFKAMKESLDNLEQEQAKILETTKELARRNEMNDEVREQLGKMDREQEDMKELIEELAQDLYQFPELPVCNELNSLMNEIFEDVEQAIGSENEPAIEIAVQKEDAFLDAIRRTKERVEDIEMWMPDVPDNIVWNMESFDTDEFPDMPLVPLPDELDDIVGDLLDQAAEIDAQSQDTTGNNMMADGEMGWDIMDGPIPNFSAKGKSGNTRPNDNEMTGRSGAGREGQSSGELVEGVSKGLEGRETHARRTRDPFQSGMVEEDESSTLDAKATGGGKLGGVSETIGMFGNAPRRDQGMPDHGDAAAALRRETEAIYTAARLLYLPTGSLGSAARTMKLNEDPPPELTNIDSLHRTVVRRLQETRTELETGVVLAMPTQAMENTGGDAAGDIDINAIDEKYRGMVSDYYKDMDSE